MTMLDIALDYCRRGWNPVPVAYRSKRPTTGTGWQTIVIDETNAVTYFNGEQQNIGIMMGSKSGGLTDLDLDCAEAVIIAPYILPTTKAIFGRASARASHHLFYSDLADSVEIANIEFTDPTRPKDEGLLLEVRVGGGGKASQTVFPPSVHTTGEPITWEEAGEPLTTDANELLQSAAAVAAYSLLARYWPATGSGCHSAARIVGGFLSRTGKRPEVVRTIVETIAHAMHSPRHRELSRTAEDAAKAYRDGKHAFGLNGLRETFGVDVANKVAEWLSYTGDVDPPKPEEQQDQTKPLIQSSAQFVAGFVPPDYLIDGLLQRRFIYSLTARTGGGKTAIVLLFAALVGLGQKLGDREVGKGRALILAGENPDDVRMRWIATAQQMGFNENAIEVHFIPGALKLSTMMARIRKETETIGELTLVIVDTSVAYFEGDDENSNVQAAAHARRLRKLVELPGGPCVVVTCHPTKNAPDDNLLPRGGGAFLNEMDGNLTAVRTDMSIEIHWQGKFRGPDFAPIGVMLRPVTHQDLKDSNGKLIPTVVAGYLSEIAQEDLKRVAQTEDTALLKAVAENGGLSWSDYAKALGWFTKAGEPYKSRVSRTLTRLKKFRLVVVQHDGLALTKAGEKTLAKITDRGK